MGDKLVSILSSNLLKRVNKGLDGYYSKVKYNTAQKDHYDALGISASATQSEIKSAFYKLSLQYHPDKDASVGAKERFQEISRAYEVLGNNNLRRRYDMRRRVVEKPKPTQEKSRPNVQTVFTVKPPKSGKIYDFDEWTRQHYGTAFQKQKEFEQKFHTDRQTRNELNRPEGFSPTPVLIVFSIVLCYLLMLSQGDVDQHTSKPQSSIKT